MPEIREELVRTIPAGFWRLAELLSFHCAPCRQAETVEGDDPRYRSTIEPASGRKAIFAGNQEPRHMGINQHQPFSEFLIHHYHGATRGIACRRAKILMRVH
jgi:hypothetical protein